MEFDLYLLSAAIASLVTLTLSSLLYKHFSSRFSGRNIPPGKTGWPIIGESLEFMAAGRKGQPERFILDRVAKYSSNVFKTSLFLEPLVVVAVGAEANTFLFTENKLVRPWWPNVVRKLFPTVTIGSDAAIRLKKMMSPLLQKSRGLENYIAAIDTIAKRHFASEWEGRDSVLVLPLAHRYTMTLACKLFLSVDDPEQVDGIAALIGALLRAIFSIPINLPGTWFSKGLKASKLIRETVMAIAKQRKIEWSENSAPPKQDMLSHLMMATDDSGKHMTESEIADNILGMLIGGYDPTSTACALVVKYLAELPEIYHCVYQEQMEIRKSKSEGELLDWNDLQKMKYSWNVACEVMRLTPPQQGAFREAIQDFEYQGYFIPKGCKLYWSAYATHMNPKYYPEPEKFDPSRFQGNGVAPYTYVPFGGGVRMCPGKEYSRLELLVFMHNLVTRFKFEKVIADEKVVLDPMPNPAKGLPIRLFPHQS
uniref:Cytochrome P450 n=1 Tax=Kalanchoe fedtschenkoi TaxID=63787 RepID=A0A7N0T8F8_KALFE